MLIGRYATDELENVITPTPNQNIYLVHHTHIYADLYFVCDPNTKCGIPLYRRQVFILDINNIISNIISNIINNIIISIIMRP